MKKTQTTMDKLTCESCGKSFECGANVGKCWCFEVELSQKTRDDLSESFAKCLCQDCLLNHEKIGKIDVEV